jgi:Bacterial protein of unknown function (DUF885)
MTDIASLSDAYVTDLAAADPCLAALLGIGGHDGELTDYSPEGLEARHDLNARTLGALNAAPAMGDADRIGAAVLRERLEVELRLAEAGTHAELNSMDSPPLRIRQAIEALDRGVDTPWTELRERVRALPRALAGLRRTLERARQQRRLSAVRQIIGCAKEARIFTGYLSSFVQHCPLEAFADDVARANRSLVEFARFLVDELAPLAPTRDAVGPERYLLATRNFLGATVDLAETYAWGWSELRRLEEQMAGVAAEILPGEPLPAVYAALDADREHRITGAENFRGWIQDLADRTIDELAGIHFDIPEPLRKIDCRIPPVPDSVYYLAPAEDLTRPGTLWWHVPDTEVITWTALGTLFHEGAPGHHLQMGANIFNSEKLNRFQRISAELHPGHSEGWGLYAEKLMDELGFYRTPAHRLGMLAGGQQLRAARIVLDIGLHLDLPIPYGTGFHEGERWTPRLAADFLSTRCGSMGGESFVDFEIDRYLGCPGQAIAYKIGERVWMDAREEARIRHNARFDLRAFHTAALDLGPIRLDLLGKELASWTPLSLAR